MAFMISDNTTNASGCNHFQDFDFNIEGENILLRWQHVNDLSNLGFSAQTLSDGNASGCNPISGSSSTMVAGRRSLGCKNSVAIQIKRAVPSDKVCAEKPSRHRRE
jgi:hypothetical protein